MQLFTMGSDTKYRVFFNELESNNLVKSLGSKNISIRNVDLCSYIEKALPNHFNECKNKRVMVLNILNDRPYISAVVLVQDVNAIFPGPREKRHLIKVTKVIFENGNDFKQWLLDKKYSYKVVYITSKNKVKVAIFNMTVADEMNLAQYGAEINSVDDILSFMLIETKYKLEKCFQ